MIARRKKGLVNGEYETPEDAKKPRTPWWTLDCDEDVLEAGDVLFLSSVCGPLLLGLCQTEVIVPSWVARQVRHRTYLPLLDSKGI